MNTKRGPAGGDTHGAEVDGRPAATRRPSLSTVADPTDRECTLCGGRYQVAYMGCSWCTACVLELLAGLRRRREAEARLEPIDRMSA